MVADLVGKVLAEPVQLRGQAGVGQGQDPHGQEGGVAGPVDGHRGHRNALGHLDHGQQRVEATQIGQGHRDPDDRQGGGGGGHPGQVGRTAGGGDDHLDAGIGGAAGEGDGVVGGPVGRQHPHLDGDGEGPEGLDGVVHDRRVGGASHDDGNGHGCILPDRRSHRSYRPAAGPGREQRSRTP